MAKGYVPIFFDWVENTQDLCAEEKGNLIDAVVLYASGADGWIDLLKTSGEKIAFRFMRGQVDRNIEISKARAMAGRNKKDQNETNENKPEQNETKVPKEKKNNNNNKNKDIMFDKFWDAYPRHVNKPAARKAFDKLNPDDETMNQILNAIRTQKMTAQWQENNGQYIPHPSTWLNGHRWEDEVKTEQAKKNVVAHAYSQRDYVDEDEEAKKRMLDAMGVMA